MKLPSVSNAFLRHFEHHECASCVSYILEKTDIFTADIPQTLQLSLKQTDG